MFLFRLEKVLRYRRRQVDAQARRVAEVGTRVRAAEARRAEARAEVENWVAEAARRRPLQRDARQAAADTRWLTVLRDRMDRQEDQLATVRAEFDEERERLVAAHRDREVLERLKARQLAQWKLEEARRERKRLDEVAQIRAAAARQEGSDSRA